MDLTLLHYTLVLKFSSSLSLSLSLSLVLKKEQLNLEESKPRSLRPPLPPLSRLQKCTVGS